MSGYLYIISNENFPGWIKIGVTKDLKSRLDEQLEEYQRNNLTP